MKNTRHAIAALIVALVAGVVAAGCGSSASAGTAPAQKVTNLPSWTFPVSTYIDNGSSTKISYQPVTSVTKRWSICVLLPDVFDAYWLAMDYGLVTEARRDHLDLTVYNGGGYVNLATQVNQMNECITQNANAIIVGAIDATGLHPEIVQAHKQGIPVIDIANGIDDPLVAGHARDSFQQLALTAGTYYVDHNQGTQIRALVVPGPKGAIWSDDGLAGYQQALAKDPNAKIVAVRRGDTDANTTMQLIQDGLKAYPQTNAILTFDSGADTAVTAVRDLGLTGKVKSVGFMIVPADWTDIQQGTLVGTPTDFTPILGRIAVDLAVRKLQHEPTLASTVSTFPVFITKSTMASVNKADVFAPAGFKYVFNVHG